MLIKYLLYLKKYIFSFLLSQAQNITADKYIQCLINLCKRFWTILVCYYQVTQWHQNCTYNSNADRPNKQVATASTDIVADDKSINHDEYIQQRLKKGQSRIWNDIQTKICIYLSGPALQHLKYEQFIQILSITQRLKKVGNEFCGEPSAKLLEVVREQSIAFFMRYHATSLEEICLFLDNEAWVPVTSFNNLVELQVGYTHTDYNFKIRGPGSNLRNGSINCT